MTDAGPTFSDIADWYDRLIASGSGPHETALDCTLSLLGDVAGMAVLDIACGQGLASRSIAQLGAASVVGVDSSAQMLTLARGHGGPPSLTYVEDDAQQLTAFGDATFDVVNCQLGLMDIPDVYSTARAVYRVLRGDGAFTFVIGHPAFLAPEAETVPGSDGRIGRWIGEYFDERFWRSSNPEGVRRAGNHHRMLSTYLNALADAGFTLERSEEPRPSARLAEQQPEYAAVPIVIGMRFRAMNERAVHGIAPVG
jgi:ubiquinone/menaquinone biosynthesis C-methylase UbiE